jgi:hypothetical protein
MTLPGGGLDELDLIALDLFAVIETAIPEIDKAGERAALVWLGIEVGVRAAAASELRRAARGLNRRAVQVLRSIADDGGGSL